MNGFRGRGTLVLGGGAALAVLLAAERAHASGDGAATAQLSEVVLVLVAVAVAYLVAHLALERVERRLLAVSGLEYILLGILLGPAFPQLGAFDDITGLLPIIALAAGWFGILRGMELARCRDAPTGTLTLSLFDDLGAGLVVAVPAGLIFTRTIFFSDSDADAWLCAGVLGCCAAVGSTDPIDVLTRRYRIDGPSIPLLRRSARIGDALAVIAFGVLFCWFHRNAEATILDEYFQPRAIWMGLLAIAVALGVGLGFLFRLFLAGRESDHARFLALVGIITFASGAAWLLELSLLFVNLLLGLVLFWGVGQDSRTAEIETLERTQRPMTLVLLLFAGALYRPPAAFGAAVGSFWDAELDVLASVAATAAATLEWIVAPTVAFVLLRLVGKWLGSRVASWGGAVRPDAYRGLLGMGDVAVAMAVGFKLVFDGPAVVDVTYTAILGGIVVHDLVAPRLLRSYLADAGELLFERAEDDA